MLSILKKHVEKYDIVLSSIKNKKNKVMITEIQDHLIMSEYSAISVLEVLHFIHAESRFINDNVNSIKKTIKQHMSKVCLAYTESILSLFFQDSI